MKYFEPNLIKETQKLINNNNLLILSFENNEKLLKLENYYLSKSIDLNKFNDKIVNNLYIYLPKNCIVY